MKVLDDAGGKSSRCSQCQAKLIVPVVEILPDSGKNQKHSEQPVANPFAFGDDSPDPAGQATDSNLPNIERTTRNPSPTLQRLQRRSRQQMPA